MPTLSRVLAYKPYKYPMSQSKRICGSFSLKEQLILVMAKRGRLTWKMHLPFLRHISSNPHNDFKIQVFLMDLQRRKIRAQRREVTFPRPNKYLAGKKGHLVHMGICPLVNSGIFNDSSFHFDGGPFQGTVKRGKERI